MKRPERWLLDQLVWRITAWLDPDGEWMGSRVLNGHPPLPWPISKVTLAMSDIDAAASVAAIWLVISSKWFNPVEYVCLYEYDGIGWQWVGGSREASSRPPTTDGRPASIVREGGAAVRSYVDRFSRISPENGSMEVPWVACALYRASGEITYLDVGKRRILVPAHCRVPVVWKAPPSSMPPYNPHVVAKGKDGTRLAEFGPDSQFDSSTLMGLNEKL